MKKKLSILLSCLLLLVFVTPAYADTPTDEWYDMQEEEFDSVTWVGPNEIEPYNLYMSSVAAYVTRISSGKVGLRADVVCYSSVSKITVNFYLQKLSGGKWYTVSSGSAYVTNTSYMSKSMSVSGLPSGTYRTKATAIVVDKYGYSESMTASSTGIVI